MPYTDITADMVKALCPVRPENGHKGTFGTVLIAAGSRNMPGAQVLAASSALRSGVGKVKVFAPSDSMDSTRINCPCAVMSPWGDTVASTLRLYNEVSAGVSACAIGPGLDEEDDRSKALLGYMIETAPLLVIDAGALNIISRDRERYLGLVRQRPDKGLQPAVLTPHPGEFRRLCGRNKDQSVSEFVSENNCIVVYKDHYTGIYDVPGGADVTYRNITGNNGMAKGGSGDVLTGLIAGLLAQGMKPVDAAVAGVYIHALAGEITSGEYGRRAMLPTDMVDFLSEAFFEAGWELE
ncbi:yjeF C-terminal region, hydroxyethylthiazole kinase-related [Ruminococcaceae bacterium YRB3002]|nr:yjeF C-terminal region, hydroxyethylthiazole kinase-related [Ruminococcaceae bacterium YRB3002]